MLKFDEDVDVTLVPIENYNDDMPKGSYRDPSKPYRHCKLIDLVDEQAKANNMIGLVRARAKGIIMDTHGAYRDVTEVRIILGPKFKFDMMISLDDDDEELTFKQEMVESDVKMKGKRQKRKSRSRTAKSVPADEDDDGLSYAPGTPFDGPAPDTDDEGEAPLPAPDAPPEPDDHDPHPEGYGREEERREENDEDDIEVDVVEGESRVAKRGTLKREAKSIEHKLTHKYKLVHHGYHESLVLPTQRRNEAHKIRRKFFIALKLVITAAARVCALKSIIGVISVAFTSVFDGGQGDMPWRSNIGAPFGYGSAESTSADVGFDGWGPNIGAPFESGSAENTTADVSFNDPGSFDDWDTGLVDSNLFGGPDVELPDLGDFSVEGSPEELSEPNSGAHVDVISADSTASRKRPAPGFDIQHGVGIRDDLFFSMLRLRRPTGPRQAWEEGAMAAVFNRAQPVLSMPWLALPTIGRRDSLQGLSPIDEPPERTASRTPFHLQRLMATRLAQTDDQLRAKAMRRLRDLVLADPSRTNLGRALLDSTGQLLGQDRISCVFADAFRSRATSTLVKRSMDYYKLAMWLEQHLNLQPMQLSENAVYLYLSFLRDSKAAPTSADAAVKAIWFMHSTAGIIEFNPGSFTSRITVVCRDMYMGKRLLKQAPALPASVVRALEEYALMTDSRVDSFFTNFILFCIYSSCRIGDASKMKAVEFSRHNDVFLVEASTSEAKNTNTMERRRILLPFAALGWGVFPNPWCLKWKMQLEEMKPDTIMPAFSEVSGQFLDRRITTAEANAWMKEGQHSHAEWSEQWAASESDVTDDEGLQEGCHFTGGRHVPAEDIAGDKLARAIGVPEGFIIELQNGNLDSFGQWAFCCSCDQNAMDDSPIRNAVQVLIGRDVTPQEMMYCRRLYFEGRTYAISDMQARIDRTSDDKPRTMPLAERMARIERQKSDLVGVTWTAELEPAHKLVDKIVAMQDEGTLLFIPPNACVSRVQEIQQEKQEVALTFDASGGIRMGKRAEELRCDTNGDLNLRNAWTRRNLAYDQAGLASFVVLEKWTTKLMLAKLKEPPNGYRYVTTQQICDCDKEMWLQLSQLSRGQLRSFTPDLRPLDAFIEQLTTSPEILCYLAPLQGAKRDPTSTGANFLRDARGKVPTFTIDLSIADEVTVANQLLTFAKPEAVHFGLMCGTCSRAREHSLSSTLRRQGAPEPKPLRDESNLFGKPTMSDADRTKVEKANTVYRHAINLLMTCYLLQCIVSIENPARSWLWPLLALLVKQTNNPGFIAAPMHRVD
eukprot:s1635_g5.t1